jgi:cobyrinic acid a,c-diamide synthase
LAPLSRTEAQRAGGRGEAIYAQGPVRASYLHAWFASNPEAVASLFLAEVV